MEFLKKIIYLFIYVKKLSKQTLFLAFISLPLLLIIITSINKIQWEHSDAKAYLKTAISKWGKPANISKQKGGYAIWNREQLKDTCFELIELRDESVPHCVPLPHRDFLYSYIKYEVTPELFSDVLSLSGSVSYDPLKKLIRARCGSQEANISTLYLATQIASGKQTIDDIQKNELYKKTIQSTIDPKNVEMLYKNLCDNVKNQPGNPNFTGFWPAAFKEGCCPGYNPKTNTCK